MLVLLHARLTMEDEGAGSDDGCPPTRRPAPAESPARETLRPASKNAKGKKKKPSELDDEGELDEFVVTAISYHARAKSLGLLSPPHSPTTTARQSHHHF